MITLPLKTNERSPKKAGPMTLRCFACFCILFLSSLGMAAPATAADSPAPQGFNKIGWGQPIASVRNLSITSSDGQTLFFQRPGERFTLGGADMEEVLYGFHDDRFYAAVLRFRGLVLFNRVLEALEIRHGDPDRSDGIAKSYTWRWPDVLLRLDWDGSSGSGEVLMTFIPIALEREQTRLSETAPIPGAEQ